MGQVRAADAGGLGRPTERKDEDMNANIRLAKVLTIMSFLVLLATSYYLRSEVLILSKIRFSSESVKSDEKIKELAETYPLRLVEYETQMNNYNNQLKHYTDMIDLYNTDYDEYVKRLKDRYVPPTLPQKPRKPLSPELSDKLAKNNAEFREQQYQYYNKTSKLN